jgi:hypothetical protein
LVVWSPAQLLQRPSNRLDRQEVSSWRNTALTAYFKTPVYLTVKSATLAGAALTGMNVVIKSGSTTLKSGNTPLT